MAGRLNCKLILAHLHITDRLEILPTYVVPIFSGLRPDDVIRAEERTDGHIFSICLDLRAFLKFFPLILVTMAGFGALFKVPQCVLGCLQRVLGVPAT